MLPEANSHWGFGYHFNPLDRETIVNDFPCKIADRQMVPSKLCNRTVSRAFKIKDRNRNDSGRIVFRA